MGVSIPESRVGPFVGRERAKWALSLGHAFQMGPCQLVWLLACVSVRLLSVTSFRLEVCEPLRGRFLHLSGFLRVGIGVRDPICGVVFAEAFFLWTTGNSVS